MTVGNLVEGRPPQTLHPSRTGEDGGERGERSEGAGQGGAGRAPGVQQGPRRGAGERCPLSRQEAGETTGVNRVEGAEQEGGWSRALAKAPSARAPRAALPLRLRPRPR